MKIYNILKNMAKRDYIVEQGTSGVWTYVKWNSGRCECWGKVSTSNTIGTQDGNVYLSSALPFALPSGLFIDGSKMVANVSKASFTSNNGIYGSGVNTTHVTISWFRGQAVGTQTLDANVYIIGTWK